MTTYRMMNKSMDCPICGKPLIEHEPSDRVACSDAKCKFNEDDKMITSLNKNLAKL